MNIYWIEFKMLDKSTNCVSRTEIIKNILSFSKNIKIKYFCAYKNYKKYYGLDRKIINYVYSPFVPKLRFLFIIFGMYIVIIKALFIIKPNIIIIDYSGNLIFFPLLLIRKLLISKVKIVMDIRTLPVNLKSFNWSIKIFLFSLYLSNFTCDGITFISPFMRKYCSKYINFQHKKTSIWSSGFNNKLFDPKKYRKIKTNNNFEIFYHGGLSLSRGIGNLIYAIKILKDKNYPISLCLIGNIVDKEKIKYLIHKNSLTDICKLHAPVAYEKIPQMIKNCDLPIVPLPNFIGWMVSSPIKLFEYMAMGKSIVLTDIEAHRDVVNNSKFAFFAKSSNPEDIAEAIEAAYIRRSELDILGKEARKIALKNYTWKKQANRLLRFIENL